MERLSLAWLPVELFQHGVLPRLSIEDALGLRCCCRQLRAACARPISLEVFQTRFSPFIWGLFSSANTSAGGTEAEAASWFKRLRQAERFLSNITRAAPQPYTLSAAECRHLEHYFASFGFTSRDIANETAQRLPLQVQNQEIWNAFPPESITQSAWEVILQDFYSTSVLGLGEPIQRALETARQIMSIRDSAIDASHPASAFVIIPGCAAESSSCFALDLRVLPDQVLPDLNINGMSSILFDQTLSWVVYHTVDFGLVAGTSQYAFYGNQGNKVSALEQAWSLVESASSGYASLWQLVHAKINGHGFSAHEDLQLLRQWL